MPNDLVGDLLRRIDTYDGTRERFAALINEALQVASKKKELRHLATMLARRCGGIPSQDVERWASAALRPSSSARTSALEKLKAILNESRS